MVNVVNILMKQVEGMCNRYFCCTIRVHLFRFLFFFVMQWLFIPPKFLHKTVFKSNKCSPRKQRCAQSVTQ